MNQSFQYQYLTKAWQDEVLVIREKYLPRESSTNVRKAKKIGSSVVLMGNTNPNDCPKM